MKTIIINGQKINVADSVAAMMTSTTTAPAPTVTTTATSVPAPVPSVPAEATTAITTTAVTTTTPAPIEYSFDVDTSAGFFRSFCECGNINSQARIYKNNIKTSRNEALKLSALEYQKAVAALKYEKRIRDVSIKSNAREMIDNVKMQQKNAKRNLTGLAQYF